MDKQVHKIKEWLGAGSINIFGRPFAGKDTQGRILADIFGGSLISSGDVIRHNHDNPKLQSVMASGGIISSELFVEIVIPYLSSAEFNGKPLILSEVGRLEGEDDAVMRATEQSGHQTKAVVFLDLAPETVWDRFESSQAEHDRGNRADDKKNVLQTRLDKYQDLVIPVIENYRQQGLLVEVDGSQPLEQVTKSILSSLHELAVNH